MRLVIDLTPMEEERLEAAAVREGVPASELTRRILNEYLPVVPTLEVVDPTLALFAQWDEEDTHMTPEDIAAEQREFEEFKNRINTERDRAGARPVY